MNGQRDMSDERYAEAEESGKLTEAEVEAGWHFCCELDWALINRHLWEGLCKCYEQSTLANEKNKTQ